MEEHTNKIQVGPVGSKQNMQLLTNIIFKVEGGGCQIHRKSSKVPIVRLSRIILSEARLNT
jgi:hypothetical protein